MGGDVVGIVNGDLPDERTMLMGEVEEGSRRRCVSLRE